jgi:nitrogen-specific signal transduction histidine kinase
MGDLASRPSDQGPVTGRVDRSGVLVAADAALLRLQQEAGSDLGSPLALPQIAAVVRSAITLGVPLSRSIIAAGVDRDYDLWVRVQPDAEGADIVIEGWTARPPTPPRLTLVISDPVAEDVEPTRPVHGFSVDSELRLTAMDASLAARLGIDDSEIVGQPLTRFFILADDGDGTMPLLAALGSRQDFEGQKATLRGTDGAGAVLSGVARRGDGGRFDGFDGNVEIEGERGSGTASSSARSVDPALDAALRSPLDRIIAAADRIVDRTEGPLRSDYATYAGDIAAAGRHLLSVIKAMSEGQRSGGETIALTDAAAEAVQLVQARASERQVMIETIAPNVPVTATGDPRQIVQIMVNILGNAVRHSPEGGTVALMFGGEAGSVSVAVTDQGPGVALADQARIFERYERLEGSSDGTGLGLAIARRLARAMGGDVTLDSTPGEGARFTLSLPAA